MFIEKEQEYMRIREKVRWLYYNTSCTITQCAKHYNISHGKANKMIEGKNEPKFVQHLIEENN